MEKYQNRMGPAEHWSPQLSFTWPRAHLALNRGTLLITGSFHRVLLVIHVCVTPTTWTTSGTGETQACVCLETPYLTQNCTLSIAVTH